MESEERALPEQETPAAEAESLLPAAAAPAESGEGQAPAEGWEEQAPAQELPGTPLAQFALEQQLARGRRLLDEQLRIIESVDPAVKSLADLRTQPEFGHFDKLVKSGMTISDAYKLACFDRLGRQQAAAARQAAINDVRAKEHLAPVDPRPDRGLPPQLQTRSVRACFVSTSGPSATWSPLSICPVPRN